jgi:hypothetical protein
MATRKILKNFNLLLDGTGYLGKVEEVTLPNTAWKIEEFQGGGMLAPLSVKMGMEKLTTSFVIKSFETKVISALGGPSNKDLSLTVRGAVEDNNSTTPIRVEMRGIVTGVEPGSLKVGEAAGLTCNMDLNYIKFLENNKEVYEIDIPNHVFRLGGVDHLAEERKALGV